MEEKQVNQLIIDAREKLCTLYPFLKAWEVVFDFAKRRAGICKVNAKQIGLSKEHIKNNPSNVVLDTLLHEYAHAITYQLYGDIGHGKNWKRTAQLIGAIPKATGTFNLPKHPWVLVSRCEQSETVEKVALRYRKNKNIKNCFIKGKPATKGKLYYLKADELTRFELGQVIFEKLEFIR